MGRLRYQTVAVGVIYDQRNGFLLPFNSNWSKFAFLMKKIGADDDSDALVVDALKEDIQLKFPDAVAEPVDRLGAYGPSGRTDQETYYDYSVYSIDRGTQRKGSASASEARYFSYDELKTSDDVSWSTKQIAEALVEGREVVLAIVARQNQSRTECLLVDSTPSGYFLPATRRKTDATPESVAELAMQQDAGYEGPVQAKWCAEQEIVQPSQRFGSRTTRFRFHLCRVRLPDCDLNDSQSELTLALERIAERRQTEGFGVHSDGYAKWIALEELGSAPHLSVTMQQLALDVRRAAENNGEM